MELSELTRRIGAAVLAKGRCPRPIKHVYAGDRISDLLNHAHDCALLVTNLSGTQIIRLAELMDLSALCLVNGATPDASTVAAATAHGTGLLVSTMGLFETCGRLYECLPRSGA